MSQDDLFGAPAGWYPDPLGLPQLRWWNNHAWTEQTSAARQPMVMQDTKFAWADDDLPTRREERERERARDEEASTTSSRPTADVLRELDPPIAVTVPDPEPSEPPAFIVQESPVPVSPSADAPITTAPITDLPAQSAPPILETPPVLDEPAVSTESAPAHPIDFSQMASASSVVATHDEQLDELFGSRKPRVTPQTMSVPIIAPDAASPGVKTATAIVSTGPAWLIAMIPLFQLVFSLLLLNFGLGGFQSLFIGILTVPYLLVIVLAIIDYRLLKRGGNNHPAHWGWAALTAPVYLLMRARAVISRSGKGIGPVLVWFALGFLHLASVVAIPGLLISVVPNLFVPQIEESIAQDASLASGTDLTVTCPATPPVLIGGQFVCESVNQNGSRAEVTVSLVRSNGWIDWQVIDWGVNSLVRG